MIDKLADILVRYSTGIRPGEVVSLIGPTSTEPLLTALFRQVLRAGGHPIPIIQSETCEEILFQEGNVDQLTFPNPLDAREVEVVDVAIHVLSDRPPKAFDAQRGAIRQQARRPLLQRFLARTAERSLRWTATIFLSAQGAAAAGLKPAEYERLFERVTHLDCPDPIAQWRQQGEQQGRLIDIVQQTRELRFVTPAGTDLRVGIAQRRWHNGQGHQNFPDGEVFTAPIEDATEGTFLSNERIVHGGQTMRGIRLVFRAGRVAEASADEGEKNLLALLDADAGARVLGEVALGCNYAIDHPTGQTLLDEKRGGTFHIALGASLPQSGGRNVSALHWDLVADLHAGGRIEADGQTISANGRFLDPTWPQPLRAESNHG